MGRLQLLVTVHCSHQHCQSSSIESYKDPMTMLAAVCLLSLSVLLVGPPRVAAAPAPDWPERYLDRELAVELYGLLQNYLAEGGSIAPARGPETKRNSEIINSLLALPKSMADVGRR